MSPWSWTTSPILFDCGRGALTQLIRAGLDPSKVEHVFLTHLWSNAEEERLKKEVAAHFFGEIVVGRELLSV